MSGSDAQPTSLVFASSVRPIRWSFLYYAYDAKTEEYSLRRGQFLCRLNPTASLVDFGDLSNTELDVLPFDDRVDSNTS